MTMGDGIATDGTGAHAQTLDGRGSGDRRVQQLRDVARGSTVIGVAALIAGFCYAWEVRPSGGVRPLALLSGGAGLVAIALALLLIAESQPDGLTVPQNPSWAASGPLPAPTWWPVVGATGVLLAWGGAMVNTYLAGVGVALAVFSVGGLAADARRLRRTAVLRRSGAAILDRPTVRLARHVVGFARRHGGASATVAAPERLGRSGAVLVLRGADGQWGQVLVPSEPTARLVLELVGAAVQVGDDGAAGELADLRTGPAEWQRMAGRGWPALRAGSWRP